VASVQFEGVSKNFGRVAAVRDIQLKVADGEFLVLVGPSGSGKTTILRLLAGLEHPTGGKITIDSTVVNDVHAADRNIAMVFQTYALYPHMTVRKNLEYGLKRRKTPPAEIARRIGEATTLLGVANLLDRHPSQLSGGQAQRVAVCRALVRNPAVLLMDEPLSNLDAKLRSYARSEIKRVQEETGVTTVYVTHDQVEAMTMGDRIAVIHDGRIAQLDVPRVLYREPADTFVAGFIGSPAMNIFPASLMSEGARSTLRAFGATLGPIDLSGVPGADQCHEIGIRPEDLRLEDRDGAGMLGPLTGTVVFIEDFGRERFLHVDIGADRPLVVESDDNTQEEFVGEVVKVFCRTRGIHLFDETGKAIAHLSTPPTVRDRAYEVASVDPAGGS
jgi:multiple sugar transport system ATP-binding protein